jgi:transposase
MLFGIIFPMTTAQISDPNYLQKENAELRSTITEQCNKIIYLEEQLAWFQRQIFGRRSERIVSNLNEQQLSLEGFDQQEKTCEETQEIPAHQRKKPNRQGQDKITLPSDLPVETIILDLSDEQKVCPKTGVALVKIGEETTHKLVQKPGSYYIKEIIRPKYVDPSNPDAGVLIADLPDSIIPKCRADESFLAEVATRKFADHLPLYRISEILNRNGIQISRKLLSQWIVRLGATLTPLYKIMLSKVLASNNIFIDESPVRVLEEESKLGYMWTIVGGEGPNPPYRIYDFREDRRHDHVLQMLKSYRGVLHSDKYGVYETLAQSKQIIWCPCWAHVRRKFFEAEGGDPPLREWVLSKIQTLFELEEAAWKQTSKERLKIREDQEIPIIDELIERIKGRLIEGKILPKSKFKEALGYFCSLIPYLKNYTRHSYARLDNNVAERALRPLAIGRKNWLFFGSMEGGEAAAVLLSLVQTCRGLNINPREYLEDLFRRFMSHPANCLDELLPDQWLLSRRKSQ